MTFQTGEERTDPFMDCTEMELSDEMTEDCSFAATTQQYKTLARVEYNKPHQEKLQIFS